MADYMGDLGLLGINNSLNAMATQEASKNSTNKKAGKDLDMNDFLQLMVAMFQNQSIDSTADTGEMLNQMVQMSVITAISDISTIIQDSTTLTYAASLVGKDVTVGVNDGNKITEVYGKVTATGMLGGQQVIFLDDNEKAYFLSNIMAVGKLPETAKTPEEGTGTEGTGPVEGSESGQQPDENPEGVENPEETPNPSETQQPETGSEENGQEGGQEDAVQV